MTPEFEKHLKECKRIVEEWPDWKQAVLGQSCGSDYKHLPGDDGEWPPEGWEIENGR